MDKEIKERIAAINSGIIPEGYKKTKVGIVPVEWKDTHFSELFIEKKNVTSDFEKYPLYSLTIEEGVVPKSDRYERSHLVKKDDIFKIVSENDFVYNPMNVRFGALARYKGQEDVSVSGYYDIFSVNESVSKEYMENFLLSEPMINYYNRVSTGSLKEKQRVHFSQFLDFVLPIPPLPEQQKIAEILSTQDKLIELQEKKIEQLKELKKAYLQKMFPKKGSKYPELRFKGFTDPWEQRELSQFVEFYSGLTYSPSDVQEAGTLVLRSSNVKDGAVVDADNVYVNDDVVNSENVRCGDIIVVVRNGSRALIGKHAEIREEMPKTVIGAFMTGIRSQHPSFVNALLSTQQFENEVAQNMGATINQITGYMFAKMSFTIPDSKEQDKIGLFFKDLDSLITLHQRKSEQEKQKKKALMQLLLTGIVRTK